MKQLQELCSGRGRVRQLPRDVTQILPMDTGRS
jgi:hypothetical protein